MNARTAAASLAAKPTDLSPRLAAQQARHEAQRIEHSLDSFIVNPYPAARWAALKAAADAETMTLRAAS